jgi:hypothetical protein
MATVRADGELEEYWYFDYTQASRFESSVEEIIVPVIQLSIKLCGEDGTGVGWRYI